MTKSKELDDSELCQNFEDILEKTGGFGRFQCLVLFALLVPEIPAAFVAFSPVFVGKQPELWHCVNQNTTEVLNSVEICKCNGTFFATDSSIVTEWNLICESAWVSDFITSIQMLGMLTGSLFSSQISDWYGRKLTYLGVCMVMAFGQGLSALAPNPIVYAVARFLCGAGLSGFMGMSTIYPMEFLTPRWRLLCGSVGPWGEGVMLLALVAYYVEQWRLFLWVTALPFLFVACTLPFIPESPRWLLRGKRFNDAEGVLRRIQRINKKDSEFKITTKVLERVAAEDNQGLEKSRYSYLDFFRYADLRTKTLLLMGIWFSWALVYFGISYNIKNLRGNIFINVAFMGLSDALGYPTALFMNNRFGRRKSLIAFMSVAALFLVILAISDLIFGITLTALVVTILCQIGKFGLAGARSSARCLTGESFPTPIRTMGYGISGVTAGVGGILSPQIAFFGSQWWKPLPFVTFAFISVGGSALSLMLPETAGRSLQEQFGKDDTSSDSKYKPPIEESI